MIDEDLEAERRPKETRRAWTQRVMGATFSIVPDTYASGIYRADYDGFWITNGVDIIYVQDARSSDLARWNHTILYRCFASNGNLLYVGISRHPAERWTQHRADKDWWTEVATISGVAYPTRHEAQRAEEKAIRAEHPRYNVIHSTTYSLRKPSKV